MATKFDIYEEVTNKIIAALEAGTPPWRKPWTGERGNAAFPLRSNGESYRGINVIMLWLTADERGYTSPFWFTYRQAQELGGQVRKGEKSARVVKYGTFEKEGDNGEERKIGYLKSYSVFNADQIADLPEEYYRKPEPARDIGTEADPELEAFFDATGLDRISSNVPQAYYNTANDQIICRRLRPFMTLCDTISPSRMKPLMPQAMKSALTALSGAMASQDMLSKNWSRKFHPA